MAAHVVDPTPELAELLRRFAAEGGVLEFLWIAVSGDISAEEERHRVAAELSLRLLQQKVDAWGESLVRDFGGTRDSYFRVAIPPGYTPSGRRISVDEFLGPMFSRENGFQRRELSGTCAHEMAGFAYALMEPPHRLNDPQDWFLRFKSRVFKDFPDAIVVYSWEADGLNYFDAGREWWGTFYWTVQVAKDEPIIAILGSSTD